jgi:hypothetical protein
MKSDEATSPEPTGKLGPRKPVPIPADALWISARQVRARYGGRSHMWIERKIKNDPKFPKPTYFGRLKFFRPSKLDEYDRDRIDEQTSKQGGG